TVSRLSHRGAMFLAEPHRWFGSPVAERFALWGDVAAKRHALRAKVREVARQHICLLSFQLVLHHIEPVCIADENFAELADDPIDQLREKLRFGLRPDADLCNFSGRGCEGRKVGCPGS
ncbi:MAG: hypothetical protein AAFQ42_11330, partial [Pseudomonadota bacterium]